MKTATDIMTHEVISVTLETTVKELATLLTANNISGVPVVNDSGDVIGVVTESDLIDQNKKVHIPTVVSILDSFLFLESTDKMEQEIRKIAGSTVADIYTADIVTVDELTPIDELATLMSERNIHTLPVLKNGKLTGIVGKRDIIKTIIS